MNLITVPDLAEENFDTGLREVIGMTKRSGDKEEMRRYCRENEERFRRLSEDTYDTIGAMINHKSLLKQKETCRNQKGGIDMCKAIEDMIEEGMNEGKAEGAVLMCRELGLSREAAVKHLSGKPGLSETQAKEAVKKYWDR